MIKKRTTILVLSVLLSWTFCWATETKPPVVSPSKPNVLFIAIDDMNDWNGVLGGNPLSMTPHIEKLANLLDIYPTLASLTGLEPPEGQLEGNDLSILMKNPDAPWDDTTVTTFGYKNYGVRSDRYRYIVYEDGTEELYDHTKDRWEWTNLADNPEYAAIKKKMREEIPTHHEPMGAIEAFFESRE